MASFWCNAVIALYPNLLMNLFITTSYCRWGLYESRALYARLGNQCYVCAREQILRPVLDGKTMAACRG